MLRLTFLRCHEWRERLPVRVSGYVCVECGQKIACIEEMAAAPQCRSRLAPVDWLPLTEQAGAYWLREDGTFKKSD